MLRSRSAIMMFVGAVVLCAIVGFAVGKVLASGNGTSATMPFGQSYQSDAPTPAQSTGAIGSLGLNPSVPDVADLADSGSADNGTDAPEVTVAGTVAQVDPSRATMTLATAQGNTLVDVGTQTEFDDGLATLADVHTGMALSVSGQMQPNGDIAADSIGNDAPTADPGND